MSAKLLLFLFPLSMTAQFTAALDGISVSGELRGARPADADHLFIDLKPLAGTGQSDRAAIDSQGRFSFLSLAPGAYQLRVFSSLGGDPLVEQQLMVSPFTGPINLELPQREESKPISGIVSIEQLRHPPSKKAVRALIDAQKFSQAHDFAKAIEKLQLAIKLDPQFREAHLNLGAQYARQGRYQEALPHLETALAIGPPDAKIYSNLAFCYYQLRRFPEAETLAKKALALDPSNNPPQILLRALSALPNTSQTAP